MEQKSDLSTGAHGQDSAYLPIGENTTATFDFQLDPNFSNTESKQPNEKSSSEMPESLPENLTIKLHMLKYAFSLLEKVNVRLNEVNQTLMKRELVEGIASIGQLRKEFEESDRELIENKSAINELKLEFSSKCAQLTDNLTVIKHLQEQCVDKDKKLVEKESLIVQLQKQCHDKDKELTENANAMKELQAECANKAESISKRQSVNVRKTIFLCFVVALVLAMLFFAANIGFDRQQHLKYVINEPIFLKQSTKDKLNALSDSLNRDGQEFDANNSTFISDQKYILLHRAKAYFELEDYSDAYQHLEVALHLDPNYEEAQKLLAIIQEQTYDQTQDLI